MMRPRWQKIVADLLSHKMRSILVVASIAVGLIAIGMITTSYEILSEDIRAGYRALNPANIQVTASLFDEDYVRHIRKMPAVAAAEGAWNTSLQIRNAAGEWKPINIKAQDFDERTDNPIGRPLPVAGVWPPADRQIVLDVNRLKDVGTSVGDEVEIKLPSGTIRRMTLVGVVRDQTIGSSGGEGGFFLADIQGYVTLDTLPWLEQPEGFNTLYATVVQGGEERAAIQPVADAIVADFEKNGLVTYSSVVRLSSEHPNVAYVDAMVAVIYLLGFLVVFLSGFLITNTFSALLNQQVEQIGVMKTIGATRRQIIGLYMVLILVFSLIALAIAVPVSIQAAFGFLAYLADRINFQVLEYRLVPAAFLLQAAVALIVPQVAGAIPIVQGTAISVREALSGVSQSTVENHGLFFRLLGRLRFFSRPVLISLRNTFRRRTRLVLTLITLILGGATFMATFNVSDSIQNYADRLGRYFLADVNLTLNRPYRIERVTRDVMQIPGVAAVEGWSGAQATVVTTEGNAGETLMWLAPPADSQLIEPMMLAGRWLQPDDEHAIVFSEIFPDIYPELGIGDTVRLKVGQIESDWTIVGFFQFAGRSSGLVAYTNYEAFTREYGYYGRAASYRITADREALTLEEQEELVRRVDAHLTALGYEINDVDAGRSMQGTTSEGLMILTTFLLTMSFLLASVGSIGLAGMMSLNVMERTREIGVMRAIGGSNRAIIAIVLVEGVIIGLLSWVLACLAAVPMSKQLADTMFQIIFDRNATLVFTPTGFLIWLGVVLVLSVIASVIPAYNASRLTIREVLAYE